MKKVFTVLMIAVTLFVNSATSATALCVESPTSDPDVVMEAPIPGWLIGLLTGFHVSWERGYKDCGTCDCAHRGMCTFNGGLGNGLGTPIGDLMKQSYSRETRYAGFDQAGNMFILVFNPTSIDFSESSFYQDGDIQVPADLARYANMPVYTIRKGSYPIERDTAGKWIAVRFVK